MTGTHGTGNGGSQRCNDRHALNWAGVIALASLTVGTILALTALKVTEGVIILVFGVPGTVIGLIGGYIGGRAMANQQNIRTESANITGGGAPSAANVESQVVNTQSTQPAPVDPAEAGG